MGNDALITAGVDITMDTQTTLKMCTIIIAIAVLFVAASHFAGKFISK